MPTAPGFLCVLLSAAAGTSRVKWCHFDFHAWLPHMPAAHVVLFRHPLRITSLLELLANFCSGQFAKSLAGQNLLIAPCPSNLKMGECLGLSPSTLTARHRLASKLASFLNVTQRQTLANVTTNIRTRHSSRVLPAWSEMVCRRTADVQQLLRSKVVCYHPVLHLATAPHCRHLLLPSGAQAKGPPHPPAPPACCTPQTPAGQRAPTRAVHRRRRYPVQWHVQSQSVSIHRICGSCSSRQGTQFVCMHVCFAP